MLRKGEEGTYLPAVISGRSATAASTFLAIVVPLEQCYYERQATLAKEELAVVVARLAADAKVASPENARCEMNFMLKEDLLYSCTTACNERKSKMDGKVLQCPK